MYLLADSAELGIEFFEYLSGNVAVALFSQIEAIQAC